ncbi:MAG TPA: hypothetical protein PLH65_00580 [bacterium]|nr:hypothetical protein [bacterium]HPN67045.1 hypothetical protein [bacterium]
MGIFIIILFVAAVTAASILSVRHTLNNFEGGWICQDGIWVKHGNSPAPPPKRDCPKMDSRNNLETDQTTTITKTK